MNFSVLHTWLSGGPDSHQTPFIPLHSSSGRNALETALLLWLLTVETLDLNFPSLGPHAQVPSKPLVPPPLCHFLNGFVHCEMITFFDLFIFSFFFFLVFISLLFFLFYF